LENSFLKITFQETNTANFLNYNSSRKYGSFLFISLHFKIVILIFIRDVT
jgi:hypothetical protein